MNVRKTVLFTVILMIAISSLSMVSAGVFDFLGDDSSDAIDGNIKSSSYDFTVVPSTEVTTGDHQDLAYFDCDISIELNASQDQLNKLQEAIDNGKTIDIEVVPDDTSIIPDVSSNNDNISINDLFSDLSLNDHILRISVEDQPADNFNDAVSESTSGSITSGKLMVSEDNLEINFS